MAATLNTLFCLHDDNTLWRRDSKEETTEWIRIGTGPSTGTRALAALAGMLYAVDANGQLWRAVASSLDPPCWTQPQIQWSVDPTVSSMCADADILYASTCDNRLLKSNRDFIAEANGWVSIHDCGPSLGLAVVDGCLFRVTSNNRLCRLDLSGLRRGWR